MAEFGLCLYKLLTTSQNHKNDPKLALKSKLHLPLIFDYPFHDLMKKLIQSSD